MTWHEESPQAGSYRQNRFPLFPGSCEILLIRHGESEAFVEGTSFPLVDGHGDPALSPLGHDQAERLGERLATAGIDAIYVTTLRRTAQTAAPLAARLGLTPRVEPDLREVHLGEWEGGLYRKMVTDGDPVVLRAWAEERWDIIPGAEPADAFAARIKAGIDRIARAHPGERVAVVSHGGAIGQVLAMASGSTPFAFVTSDNGAIARIIVTGDRWFVRAYNDVAHLESLHPAGTEADGADSNGTDSNGMAGADSNGADSNGMAGADSNGMAGADSNGMAGADSNGAAEGEPQ